MRNELLTKYMKNTIILLYKILTFMVEWNKTEHV